MKDHLHKNAKTTLAQRAYIQNETGMNVSDLASKMGVSETTIRKWKKRSFVNDQFPRPKKRSNTLDPIQELSLVLIRICFRTGLDDLVKIATRFIAPSCSRSSLNRCLKKYHISRLSPLADDSSLELKDYRGTHLYYKKISFGRIPGLERPVSVQTLLDCSFRMVYADIDSGISTQAFINKILKLSPPRVLGLIFSEPLVLNGSPMETSDTFPSDAAFFEKFCLDRGMRFRLVRSESEEILAAIRNTYSDILEQNAASMESGQSFLENQELMEKIESYNFQMGQRRLKAKPPHQAMKYHYAFFPNSFQSNPE